MQAVSEPAVFISYSSTDQRIATLVCDSLERDGISCWISSRDVGSGTKAFQAIPERVSGCTVVVLVLSAKACESEYVERELQLALHHRKTIVPFRVEQVTPDGAIGYILTTVQWEDGWKAPVEQHIPKLVDRVAAILKMDPPRRANVMMEQPKGGYAKALAWGTAVVVVAAGIAGEVALMHRQPAAQGAAPVVEAPRLVVNPAPPPGPPVKQQAPVGGRQAGVAGVTPVKTAPVAAAPLEEKEQTAEELRARSYVITGRERMNSLNYVSARDEFQMAVNLDPNNAAAKAGLKAAKKAMGDTSE